MNSVRAVRTIFLLPLVFLFFAALDGAYAYTFSVLYTFQGGKDGAGPYGHLVRDNAGNLYGATFDGGGGCQSEFDYGCGTAYKLAPDGTETVLRAFGTKLRGDGHFPSSGLVEDKAGNFHGTTDFGGGKKGCGGVGCGTVFILGPDGTERVLHHFTGADGRSPTGLAQDSAGNLYGTSYSEGNDGCGGEGCGLVFKVAPDGTDTTLYVFQGGSDGANPDAPLIRDKAGNLYGTTELGGGGNVGQCDEQPPLGCGTVFKLTTDGTETVLYAFSGGSDGGYPSARLAMDSAGNLYGAAGGGAFGYGVVFKLTPAGVETVLYSFKGGSDGAYAGPVGFLDGSASLYGTSDGGGTGCGGGGCGTVFRLAADGTKTILHVFTGGADGAVPESALIADKAGNIYGTADVGGGPGCSEGCGVVFKLTP